MKKFIPFGEYAPDSDGINPDKSAKAQNVYPMIDGYETIKLWTAAYTSTLTSRVLGAKRVSTGNILSGEDQSIYFNSTAITGPLVNLDAGYYWNIIEFGTLGIFVGKGNAPIKTTSLTSAITAVALGGSPPQAACAAVLREFVVLGDIATTPARVQWSAFNDAEGWTPGTNQSDFQDLPTENGDVKAIVGGEEGVVFQERGITRMTYVGVPLVFQFDQISSIGINSSMSVVQVDNDIYYLSSDGFKVLKGGVSPMPIGVNRVDKLVQGKTNIVGAYDPYRNCVMWSNWDVAEILVYKIDLDRWSTISKAHDFIATNYENRFILWNDSHVAGTFSGTTTEIATVRTGVHSFDDLQMITEVLPLSRGSGARTETLYLYSSHLLSDPYGGLTQSSPYQIVYTNDTNINPIAYFRLTGKHFVFEISTTAVDFLHGFDVKMVSKGTRIQPSFQASP